ncbi:GILT-like protein 1 [Anabrus simplex]|uniref:GILT-like protein 1 n=1 Tax=Anabrus simplex TaxID=316456 RepID=UPI0035A338FF
MPFLSSVLRVKLAIFAVICFVLWQALRTVPSLSTISSDEHGSRLELPATLSFVPIEVTVFYEALCPDSRSFITKQLLPAHEKAARLMNVVLVPYGKAQTKPTVPSGYTFTCQHGPLECQANMVHACVIEKVPDKDIALRYISCMISDNMEPEQIGETCAHTFNVPWKPIQECSAGKEGAELLKHYGDVTHGLSPSVSFIPTVLLNRSQDNQAAILKNLLREVCRKFEDPKPAECS